MSTPLSRELDRLRNVVLRRIEYMEMIRPSSQQAVDNKGERLPPAKVLVVERPPSRRQRLIRFVRRILGLARVRH